MIHQKCQFVALLIFNVLRQPEQRAALLRYLWSLGGWSPAAGVKSRHLFQRFIVKHPLLFLCFLSKAAG
jgi:hypothetical protein